MGVKLTQTIVASYKSRAKRYTIRDLGIQGLLLRVEPSGRKSWFIDYFFPVDSKTRHNIRIGDADVLTITQAREIAIGNLADVSRGIDPYKKKEKKSEEMTLRTLLEEHYAPWVETNHSTTNATDFLRRDFEHILDKCPSEITVEEIEQWRNEQKRSLKGDHAAQNDTVEFQEKKKRASSINRTVSALKALLSWGAERDLIPTSPITLPRKLKPLPETDSRETIRYLKPDERKRLLKALDERENKEGKDYLKPVVILALNTGIRRNALLSLTWDDVDFENKTIRLRSGTAKNRKLNHIPMNALVHSTLLDWKNIMPETKWPWIFPSPKPKKKGKDDGRMHDCRSAWSKLLKDAGIKNFRWHDMRHDFASQLVKKNVDIVTVKELMCHSTIEMTMVYAHLDPQRKMKAVEQLDHLYK